MQKFLSITKTWRDKANGNTYFSTRVYKDGAVAFVLPMQYGYENQSESKVYEVLKKLNPDDENFKPFDVEFIKLENQKKKDVENWWLKAEVQ